MIILIMFWIILLVGCFFVGRKVAKNLDSDIRKPPVWINVLLLGYIVVAGCVAFPISSERFPLDFMKAYLLIASYTMIGIGLAGMYGREKERFMYLITLGFTIVGMISRYILEYGEVSNTYNFTTFNVFTYIVSIPVFTVIAYHYSGKYLLKKR